MLTRLPGRVSEVKVNPHDRIFIIAIVLNSGNSAVETKTGLALTVSEVEQCSTKDSDTEIGKHDDERSNHPTRQFIPVSPARSKIKDADQSMGLLEKLVTSQSDGPACAENVQKGNHYLSNNAPDNVLLLDECSISLWLRLVESSFDECPNQSMQERLDENDSTGPTMQKVEMLVWNTSDERQNAFARAKRNGKWRQGISQCANTITPTSEASSDRFQVRMTFGGCDPSLVSHTNETVVKSA